MALKKKKAPKETPNVGVEEKVPVVEENVQEDNTPVMTEDEKEAIQKQEQKESELGADTRRLQLATNLVSKKFNLDPDYRVTNFDDKVKVINMTLENGEFIIKVSIKDSERHGLHVE